MAEYPDFKHGVYGEVDAKSVQAANRGNAQQVHVYFGTAPVHLVEGGASNVNKPMLINDMSEAMKYMGYSEDWASYDLCEPEHVFFDQKAVAPLVFINVFDPTVHKKATGGTASLTPENGRVIIANAEDVYLDSIVVKSGSGDDEETKIKGTDYTVSYDFTKKVVNIVELSSGALGTTALAITWDKVDPSAVTDAALIGSDDGYGLRTGIPAVQNVYPLTGCIPARMSSPGFGSHPAVHDALRKYSKDIGKHWNARIYVDLPLTDGATPLTLASVSTWKNANGYNADNDSPFFPMAKGTDGRRYHLSVLAAANLLELQNQNGGVPFMSHSNTDCPIIADLYLAESTVGRVFDDALANKCLVSNGINSAAFVSGRWAIWGMVAGDFSVPEATNVNVNDTCLAMLYYLSNRFQHRYGDKAGKPMRINDLKAIVAKEQADADALLGIGALTYAKVILDATEQAKSDLYMGDFRIIYKVTNTPLAKSITAVVTLTEDGYRTYFEAMSDLVA